MKKCKNNAPHICLPPEAGKHGYLYQACCNDWTCERCGEYRAKHEYGRIIEGAKYLVKKYNLHFTTITCKNEPLDVAEETYSARVNVLLTSYRAHVTRSGGFWAYAQVTERQPKRKHPHSHFLMTCAPKDTFMIEDDYERYVSVVASVNEKIPIEMRYTPDAQQDVKDTDEFSAWLQLSSVKAGLGVQARLSLADDPIATAKYIAKYLFKQTMSDVWPKGWKRVRYSHTWPKLPQSSAKSAFPVFTAYDWSKVAKLDGVIETSSEDVYERALLRQCYNVVCNHKNKIDLYENEQRTSR